VYRIDDSAKEKLLHNVNNVISWFEANHMKANTDQFQYIIFSKYDHAENFIIGEN